MSLVVDGKTYKLPADIPTVASLANGPYQLALRTVKASKALNMWAGLLEQARTRLAPGLAATVAPPVERNARWNSIKGIETPFGANHGATDSKQFGYWFNYFWTEAREAYDLNPAAQAQLCDAFFAVLEADGNGGYRPTDRYAAMDNTQMQNVLLKVLRVGFKRVHVGEQKKGPFSAPQALDAKSMFALQVSGNGEARRTLPIGFRGDNRKPGDLKDGGFMARARSLKSTVHSNYGMNQAWHPFNLPVYANSLFLRKGKSKDNCLHTVISVASSLEEMLPYPLLSDPSLFGLAFKDPATWTSDDVNYVKNHWLGLQIVRDSEPNGRIDKLTTTKNIYILNMGLGQAFDTQAWQQSLGVANPFPERAVNTVLPEQILAVLSVKKHYFFRRVGVSGGVVFFDISDEKIDWLIDELLLQQMFGVTAKAEIERAIQRGIRNAKFNVNGDKQAYEKSKQVPQVAATGAQQTACPVCNATFRSKLLLIQHQNQTGHTNP